MNVAKRSISKRARLRQKPADEKRLELAFSAALSLPFNEWLSPEDEEAFRDL